jgi:DNA-binding SARP family transcriptional activator
MSSPIPKVENLSIAEEPVATFSVAILGPLLVARDSAPLDAARWPRRVISLLLMLVTSPQHRRLKEEIAAVLWPDATTQTAASNLRYTLHILRRHLHGSEPYPVVVDHGWLALNAVYSWCIDLEHFEALLADPPSSERLQQAAALYRGDPLDEVRYEDWATPVRNRVHRKWRELCLRLARLHHSSGSSDAALQSLDRVLERDPFDEEALRETLQTLSDAGRIPEALRRYRRYEIQLRAEMGVPPGEDLRAMVTELQQPTHRSRGPGSEVIQPAALIPSYPLQTEMALVGRRHELKTVLDALPCQHAAEARLVLITGATGVGKTRLLAEVARQAREHNMLTLAGACYEREGQLPYSPCHDALLDYVQAVPRAVLKASIGDLLPEIARIVPELREYRTDAPETRYSDRADERLRLYAAVAQVFERIAGRHGVVILLDDLQWADRATVHLLHFLVRQPHLNHTVFVGAYREDDVASSGSFATLLSEIRLNEGVAQHVKILPLQPLDQDDIGTLAQSWLGMACSDELVNNLWRASAGNLLYATQKLDLLHKRGWLEQVNETWQICRDAEDILPSSLREMVIRRLESLEPAAIKVLRIGAVLGQGFTHQALEDVWGSDDDTLYDALDALLDLKLLWEASEGYVFSQPFMREVIYERIPRFHRRRLHARAAHALEGIYAERACHHAAELATHFQRAAMWEQARFYMLTAGEQAQEAYAYDEAIQRFSGALELTMQVRSDPAAEANVKAALGRLLRLTGRIEEAASELRQAGDLAATAGDAVLEVAAWVGLSKTYMRATNQDDMEAALARVEALLPGVATNPPSQKLFSLYIELSTVYFSCGKYPEALAAREQALIIAQYLRDDRLIVRAEAARTVVLSILGHVREAGELALQLIPRAEAVADVEALRTALAQAAERAMLAGAFADSRTYRQRELAAAKRTGSTSIAPFVLSNIAQLSLYMGEWDDTKFNAEQALSALLVVGDRFHMTYPLAYLGELALRRGDREEGVRRLEESARIARQANDLQVLRYVQRVLAEEDVRSGRTSEAVARLAPLLDRPEREEHDVLPLLATLAWARHAQGDHTGAASSISASLARAKAEDNSITLPEALRVRGLLHAHLGSHAEAEADFRESIRLAHEMPYPFAEACAWVSYAGLARQSGRSGQACAALEQALAIFQRLHATRDIQETESALCEVS